MKKRVMIALMILFILIYAINLSIIFSSENILHPLTGAGITASVALTITEPGATIIIYSPLNQTYNFSVGDNYTLDLNVSADFNVSSWSYDLWDLKHNELVNNSVAFSPNTTFNAVRWSNELIVYAVKQNTSEIINASVIFYIEVPNSAPYFSPVNSSIYVCEDTPLSYLFNVTDVDEEVLQLALTPTNPFYLDTIFTSSSAQTSIIELFSGVISESDTISGANNWRVYDERIEVTDGDHSDTAYTNITAIGINDAPSVETIGVQTVQTKGDNSTFFEIVSVSDEENGNENSTGINFNISYINGSALDLFGITNEGVINFTPNENQTGVYNLTICVNDTGISNPFVNISYCEQDGGSITLCQNFSLTVTDTNRPPTITSYYPGSSSFTVSGTTPLYFNVTNYDPDWTIPDTYWYVDGSLAEYDSGDLNEEFSYTFGCGVSGIKTVTAEITDGLENDSVSWTVTVTEVECPVPEEGGGGGGGGGGGPTCAEKWACSIWGICQSAAKSLDTGLLSGYDYRNILDECADIGLSVESCGIQTRVCFDSSFCNTTYTKPTEFQTCYYTAVPDCNDGIKNCHDGACELLIDCGGPCSPCPSCSDKIKNQGEEGVDCGGPCPWRCEGVIAVAKGIKPIYIYLMLLVLLILIILVIIKIRRILRYRKSINGNI
ncbi:MAG: hypothetical protein PVJ67_04585 [Candidatus Pacearchaeota archaeon]|jgi:hypothetical protein